MKCLQRILIIVVTLLLSVGVAYAVQQDKSPESPQSIHTDRIILVNNLYPEQVRITYLCVYHYKEPWKGSCERITKKHPGFYLSKNEQLRDIQRIGLIGKNLLMPGTMAECLVHFDHGQNDLKRLENSKNYIAQVNYVSGRDMVCSLLTESN